MPEEAEHELVMPFVTVKSKGGPHDDRSYVAGWEMGSLDCMFGQLLDTPIPASYQVTISVENEPQADLIALKYGYVATFTPTDTEGWSVMEFEKEQRL